MIELEVTKLRYPSDQDSVFNLHGFVIEIVFRDSSLALSMVNNRFSCTSKEILASNKNKP